MSAHFKNAMTQYIAFFIPLYLLLFRWLLGFTLRTKIFEVQEVDELPKSHHTMTPLQVSEKLVDVE